MLTKLRVKNFKSLRDVELELGRRNVLVGPNMAGKSNIIDLFRFVYQMTFPASGTWGLPNAILTRGGFGELLWKGGDVNVVQIALSGESPRETVAWIWDYEIVIQGDPSGGGFRVAAEELHVRDEKGAFNLIKTDGYTRKFLDFESRDLGSVNDVSRSVLELEVPGWSGNFVRSDIAKWRFYEFVPHLMRLANQTAAVKFLQEHGENLSQWLSNLQLEHYDDSFARIQQVLIDSLPQVLGLFSSPTQQSTVALGSREKYLSRPVTLSQMSAGELAFIAFLSLIYAPRDRAASLYCIEDLENYLHPALIGTLLEVLRQSQEEWERGREAVQIVMTTHSPLVVDKMKLDEIIFVEKKKGATVCSRPGSKSHLQKLIQDEKIGLGDLAYSGALGDVGQ